MNLRLPKPEAKIKIMRCQFGPLGGHRESTKFISKELSTSIPRTALAEAYCSPDWKKRLRKRKSEELDQQVKDTRLDSGTTDMPSGGCCACSRIEVVS